MIQREKDADRRGGQVCYLHNSNIYKNEYAFLKSFNYMKNYIFMILFKNFSRVT